MKDVKVQISKWENQFEKSQAILKYREEEQTTNLQKLILSSQPLHLKMEKLQKKIESVENVEFMRLRNSLKNN